MCKNALTDFMNSFICAIRTEKKKKTTTVTAAGKRAVWLLFKKNVIGAIKENLSDGS